MTADNNQSKSCSNSSKNGDGGGGDGGSHGSGSVNGNGGNDIGNAAAMAAAMAAPSVAEASANWGPYYLHDSSEVTTIVWILLVIHKSALTNNKYKKCIWNAKSVFGIHKRVFICWACLLNILLEGHLLSQK